METLGWAPAGEGTAQGQWEEWLGKGRIERSGFWVAI